MKGNANKTVLPHGEGNTEVEFRALLDDDQVKILLEKLKSGEVESKGEEKIIDLYFCKNDVKDISEVEMKEVGSYSLRLREKDKNGTKGIDLNVKIITSLGDHNVLDEHETVVESLEESYKILTSIGFKLFLKLKKTRNIFYISAHRMTVNIEYIEDFGFAIEVEIITTLEMVEESKQKIKNYLSDIGVKPDQMVTKSITYLLMNKIAKFDGSVTL